MTWKGQCYTTTDFFFGGMEGRKRIRCFCKNECKQGILSVLVCSLWQGVRGCLLELIFVFVIFLFLSPKDDPFLPGGGITAPCLNLGRLFCLVQLLNVQCITWPVSQHTHYQAHFVVHCCKPCIQKEKKQNKKTIVH